MKIYYLTKNSLQLFVPLQRQMDKITIDIHSIKHI